MEIIFGIIGFFVWLGILGYLLGLILGLVINMTSLVLKILFIVIEKLFKILNISKIDFSELEIKLKSYEVKSYKIMIKRAKTTKVYFISGVIMILLSLIFCFLWILGAVHNEYIWFFLIFGAVCMFFGVSYLKIHRRFNEKRL